MEILIVTGIVVLLPVLYVILTYNAFVSLKNHIADSWSTIDTELKRRYDLIPNLVETVKGYAKHEKEVLENVIRMRNQCKKNNGSIGAQASTEVMLVAAMKDMFMLAEDYPELKANTLYLELHKELVNTEDRIQASRRFYNGNVRDFRNKLQAFPSNIIGRMFGFKSEDYFDVDPSVKEVPSAKIE